MPPPVAGYQGWWDASVASSVISSGGAVSQWSDLSGNNLHFTQATGGNKPSLSVAAMGGSDAISFNGSTSYMLMASVTLPTPSTMFIVSKSAVSTYGANSGQMLGNASSGGPLLYYRGTNYAMYQGTEQFSGVIDTNTHVWTGLFMAGAGSYLYIDSRIAISNVNAGAQSWSAQTPPLGMASSLAATTAFNGLIGEIILYPSALSVVDRLAVETYLQKKWRLPYLATFPAVRSSSTATFIAAPTTGVTVNKPAGVANGDVLYGFVCKSEASNTANFTCSGWTQVLPGSPFSGTTNARLMGVLRKVITNAVGEPSTYTFVTTSGTPAAMGAIVVCISGADTTTPEDVPLISGWSRRLLENDATPASQELFAATPGALVLQYCMLALGTTTPKTWVPPAGYTNIANVAETGSTSNDFQCGVAYKIHVNPADPIGINPWLHTADDASTDYAVTGVTVRPRSVSSGLEGAPALIIARNTNALGRMVR